MLSHEAARFQSSKPPDVSKTWGGGKIPPPELISPVLQTGNFKDSPVIPIWK